MKFLGKESISPGKRVNFLGRFLVHNPALGLPLSNGLGLHPALARSRSDTGPPLMPARSGPMGAHRVSPASLGHKGPGTAYDRGPEWPGSGLEGPGGVRVRGEGGGGV